MGFEWYYYMKTGQKTIENAYVLCVISLPNNNKNETKKHSQEIAEENIYISQTTITELKIKLRAEWSEKPTVLTTTQAA